MSSPAFPTNFTSAEVTSYAKAVGTIFGGFGVVAILLSMVMICLFIKFCCTNPKESQEYKEKVHLAVAVGISIVAVIGCGVGWGYNKQCNDGVQTMTGAVSLLFNSSANLIDSIDLTIVNISAGLDAKTNDMSKIQFSGLLLPIDKILVLIDQMQDRTNKLYNLTVDTANNVTIIKSELDFVSDNANETGLTDVPSSDDIPTIDDSYSQSIISGNNSINDMRNTTLNVRDSVNSSLSDIDTNLIQSLNAQTDSYHNKVSDLTNSFDNMRNELNNFEDEYTGSYRPQVNKYSEQRTSVVNAILILPIAVAIMSAGGVFFRMPKLLSITCALSFIFFFWYVLIAGVNYSLYVVGNGFCQNQPAIVNSVLSNMNSQFTVPGTNNSYSTGEKIGELIQCSGSNTLISVFEVGFLITDLETQVRIQAQNISDQANSMNFDSDYRNATEDLTNYKNNTIDLDFQRNKDLKDVMARLENNTAQLNTSLSEKAQDRNYYIKRVNAITLHTEKNDGTPVPPAYFGANNISSLDCNDATYTDTKNHTDLCNFTAIAVALNYGVELGDDVYTNITDIEGRVDALQTDIAFVNDTQKFLYNCTNQVQGLLDGAYKTTNQYIALIDNSVNAIINVIVDGANALASDTQCSFIGKFYADFSGGFCSKLSPSLRVIAAMMLLGAASLFGSAVLSAVSIYKIRGSDDDFEEDTKA